VGKVVLRHRSQRLAAQGFATQEPLSVQSVSFPAALRHVRVSIRCNGSYRYSGAAFAPAVAACGSGIIGVDAGNRTPSMDTNFP
jgi:hypothetical protein